MTKQLILEESSVWFALCSSTSKTFTNIDLDPHSGSVVASVSRAMQPIEKSLALLGAGKNATLTEIKTCYRKKVLAYSSSATGAAKLEEISTAYVEVSEV